MPSLTLYGLLWALAILCSSHLVEAAKTGSEDCSEVAQRWCGLDCVHVYDELNQHLMDESPGRSSYAGLMLEMASWLKTQNESAKIEEQRVLYQGALNQTIALNELNKSENLRCDQETYGILEANNQASRRGAHGSVYSSRMRLIDKVIHHHLLRYVETCREAFSDLLEAKIRRMDYKQLDRVEVLTNGFIYDNFERRKYPSYNIRAHQVDWSLKTSAALRAKLAESTNLAEIIDCTSIGSLYRWRNPLDALLYLSHDNEDRDLLATGSQCGLKEKQETISRLYNKYMVEPCEYYVNELRDLNMITDYNDQMGIDRDDSRDGKGYIERMLAFYIGRAKFEFCSVLINQTRRKFIRQLVNELQ